LTLNEHALHAAPEDTTGIDRSFGGDIDYQQPLETPGVAFGATPDERTLPFYLRRMQMRGSSSSVTCPN
jgi:hypothetical protein